ncbi:hypothetical protein DL766_009359 [Monosporascus sp. MC13-8B]|nr:hypothetical protein DL763_009026 [Monosporascus cannonballus]RYP15647.1 hypothetical protein DL766_009359 [Monosporascus sp. MC13-8B]
MADSNPESASQDAVLQEICNISFDELSRRSKPVDIMSSATPERYRLLDCTEAVSNRTLRILESAGFPRVNYAALSYVWRGNHPANDGMLSRREFSILGAEDADPISLDVLSDACAASLACGASSLWLDRLCIMQTSKQDKHWQIQEMYRVYAFATICVVAPGGLRCLASFSQETHWIHRGWTLQEVVAPPAVAVMFAWTHGAGEVEVEVGCETILGRIEVVAPGTSAMMGLAHTLAVCSAGGFEFTPDGADEGAMPLRIKAGLFGEPPTGSLPGVTQTSVSGIRLPHVAALGFATAGHLDTDEMRDFCIWQCALVRTSSRPVDIVFSIMGILGVMLDPSQFAADDRLGATIALAREVLRQGRSASWLGLSANLPPCPYLSTFPAFPRTSVATRATYDLPSGGQQLVLLTDAIYPNDIGLFPPIKGSMDEAGYHSFDALAIRVVATPAATTILSADSIYDDARRPTQLRAVSGSTWAICPEEAIPDDESQVPQSYAVMLGFYNGIPAVVTGNNIRAMLVTEHAKDRYHVCSYFAFSHEALQWASTSWKERAKGTAS